MKRIGTGMFSQVYRETETTVYIKSCCQAKEVLAHGWLPQESGRFPETEFISCGEYRQKYYPRVSISHLCPQDRKLYNTLCKLWKAAWQSGDWPVNTADMYSFWYDRFTAAKDEHPEFAGEFDTLLEALDAMSNMDSSVSFEISPRNIAIDNGRLIYLDVFYFAKHAERLRYERMQKHWGLA